MKKITVKSLLLFSGFFAAKLRATVDPSRAGTLDRDQARAQDADSKKLSPKAQFKKSRQLHQQEVEEIRRQRLVLKSFVSG